MVDWRECFERCDAVLGVVKWGEVRVPALLRTPEEAERLDHGDAKPTLTAVAERILAAEPSLKLGVVARGCDERAIDVLVAENRLPESVVVIGLACSAPLAERCGCDLPYPREVAVGERTEPATPHRLPESVVERRELWEGAFARCMKCYGCSEVCPVCGCPECTLSDELWVKRGVAPPPRAFHGIKAAHMAGRCVLCGRCADTCPGLLPLTTLNRAVTASVERHTGHRAGVTGGASPLRATDGFEGDF